MAWTWIIDAGVMLKPDGTELVRGYSGHCVADLDGVNNPACIGKLDIGPLPCGPNETAGEYTIGPLLPNTAPGGLHHLGPNIAKLEPSNTQREFIVRLGRDPDSFYIHSGVIGEPPFPEPGLPAPTGSEGCICIPEPYRMEVLTSADRTLLCVPSGQPEI